MSTEDEMFDRLSIALLDVFQQNLLRLHVPAEEEGIHFDGTGQLTQSAGDSGLCVNKMTQQIRENQCIVGMLSLQRRDAS